MQGWIKLHRRLLQSSMFQNEKLLKVWVYCLLKASHADHEVMVGRQIVNLLPGQFIYGRKRASHDLNMPESTVRDFVSVLLQNKNIAIFSTNKYSVITVLKWDVFQSEEENLDSRHDSKWTTNGQQMDTNKNVKNVKNEKEVVVDVADTHFAFKDLIKHYSQNINAVPTPIESESITSWLDEGIDADLIKWAITQAALNNRRSANYVNKIILSKKQAGITTREQAEAYEAIRNAKKESKTVMTPTIDATPLLLTEEQIRKSEELDRILFGKEGYLDAKPKGKI